MHPRKTAPYIIVAIASVIACALMALCVLQLLQSRDDAMERARETSRNLGLIAERDIERNIELYDLSLQAVIHGLQRRDVMDASPGLRRSVLFDHAMTAEFLGSMLVMDAGGNIVLDSGYDEPRKGNFSDRRYFTVHRDNPNVGLYISDPFVSRLRGESSVSRSRGGFRTPMDRLAASSLSRSISIISISSSPGFRLASMARFRSSAKTARW